jgi:hypothetical protein
VSVGHIGICVALSQAFGDCVQTFDELSFTDAGSILFIGKMHVSKEHNDSDISK